MTRLIELKPDTFDDCLGSAEGLLVIDFWAPWCAPCVVMLTLLEELAAEFDGRLTFAKLNVDHDAARAVGMGVRGVPTLIFLRDGVEVDRVVGVEPRCRLRDRINGHLAGGEAAGPA